MRPDSCLLLVGEGELRAELEAKAARLGIAQDVKFLGVQSDTSIWYQAMDVFVMPSLFEGLPVVGMEAQASGLPCVFSTGVTEEVLLRPDSCRISLEQPDEAWAAVLKDADRNLPDRAQAAAQVRAAGYDIRQETPAPAAAVHRPDCQKGVPHMPEISMIVPVYNVEQYLPAALDSLRVQTCPDWEAILVDDGSPDGCGALCDAAARQDARFRVIHQKNAGVGAARNAGLAAARGTYVQFLDSDDALEPQMVEVLCRTARQTDADLILFGGYEEHYTADGTRTGCTDIAPVLEGYTGATPARNCSRSCRPCRWSRGSCSAAAASRKAAVALPIIRSRRTPCFSCPFTGSTCTVWWASRKSSTAISCVPRGRPPRATTRSGWPITFTSRTRWKPWQGLGSERRPRLPPGRKPQPGAGPAAGHQECLSGAAELPAAHRMAAAGVAHPGGTSRCAGHAPAGRPQPQ